MGHLNPFAFASTPHTPADQNASKKTLTKNLALLTPTATLCPCLLFESQEGKGDAGTAGTWGSMWWGWNRSAEHCQDGYPTALMHLQTSVLESCLLCTSAISSQ